MRVKREKTFQIEADMGGEYCELLTVYYEAGKRELHILDVEHRGESVKLADLSSEAAAAILSKLSRLQEFVEFEVNRIARMG